MKKMMMGTAIALLGSAGVASAQEWSLDITGTFRAGLAYVDVGQNDEGDIGLVRDPELIFIGRLVADNGITFGVRSELELADEVAGSSTNIDENFLFVSGSFGRFEFGEADGAADWAKYAGDVGSPWSRAGDGVGFLFDGAYYGDEAGNLLDSYSTDTSDDLKISYYTPSFSGFAVGVSYIPEAGIQNTRAVPITSSATRAEEDAFEVGAKYEGEFGDFSLAAGVGYTFGEETSINPVTGARTNNDVEGLGGSVAVGFSGFTFGVSYGHNDVDGDESDALGLGLAYETGPWVFGVDGAFHLDGPTIAGEEVEQFGIGAGVSYALAPGVAVGAGGEYLDSDTVDDESFAIGTWLDLRF